MCVRLGSMADKESMSIDDLYKALQNVSSGEESLPETGEEATSDKESQTVFSLPNLTEEPQGETENQNELEELAFFEQLEHPENIKTEGNSTDTGENCEQGPRMGFIGENEGDTIYFESEEEMQKALGWSENSDAGDNESEESDEEKNVDTHSEETDSEVVGEEHEEECPEANNQPECCDEEGAQENSTPIPIMDREELDVKDCKKQKLWSINADGEFLNIYIQEQDVTLRFPVGGEYIIHVGTLTLEIDSKNNISFYQTGNKNILSVRR
jgi:hypothetical protein